MASAVLVAKNQTVAAILLVNLGVTIPGSGSLTLTDELLSDEIFADPQVQDLVDIGDIILCDGDGNDLDPEAVLGWSAGGLSYDDKVKLDSVSTNAAALTIDPPIDIDTAAAVVGIDGYAARADHKHDITTAAPGSILIGDSSVEGSALGVARADHTHALAAPAAPVDVTKAAAAAGAATSPARADHKHDVSTASAGSIGATNSEGSATSLARSDHTHAVTDLSIASQEQGSVLYFDGANWVELPPSEDGYVLTTHDTGADPTWEFNEAGALSNIPPADVDTAIADAGISAEAARSDHKHDVDTAPAVSVGATNAEGSSLSIARADHTHAVTDLAIASQEQGSVIYFDGVNWVELPPSDDGYVLTTHDTGADPTWEFNEAGALTNVAPQDVDTDPADAGLSTEAARADHKHDVDTATPAATAVQVGGSAAEGSSLSLARADHIHTVTAGTPVAVDTAANAEGSAVTFARSDHKHDVTTATPGTIAVGDAAAEGSATGLARADHTHALTAPAAPADVTKAAASAGASTTVARADHKHDISTASAGSIGASNSEGSATSLARSDHTHAVTDLAIASQEQGSVLYFDGVNWVELPPSDDGYVLTTHDTGMDPTWEEASAQVTNTAPEDVDTDPAEVGVSLEPARADHKHDVATATAVSVGATNAEGASLSLARADHTHAVTDLVIASQEQGSVLYFDGANWVELPPSDDGYVLTTHDTGANPAWEEASAPVTNAAPEDVDTDPAAAGVSLEPARADHKHDISTASAGSVGATNSEGSATSLARSDHTHAVTDLAIASQEQGSVIYFNGVNWVELPPSDDGYVLTTHDTGADPTWEFNEAGALSNIDPVDVDTSAADAGVSTEAARQDHKHDIETATAVSIGATNAEGSALGLARADHTHAVTDLLIASQEQGSIIYFDGVNWVELPPGDDGYTLTTHSTGANPTWEPDDGQLTNVAPEDVDTDPAAVGISNEAARSDHKHDVATATAVSVGATNAEGSSLSLARADHTHAVTDLAIASQEQGSVLYFDGVNWVELPPSDDGYVLTTHDTGADPTWEGIDDGSLSNYLFLPGRSGGQVLTQAGASAAIFTVEDSGSTELLRVGTDTSALLSLTSTIQGFGLMAMDETERDAISTPLTGLLVFNTDTSQVNQYTGAAWTVPGGGLTTLQGAYDNAPTAAQILLNATPNPITIQASVTGRVFAAIDVAGSDILAVTADPDAVTVSGSLTVDDAFLNAGAANSLVFSDTFTTGAPFIGGGILSNGTVTYDNSFFIWALLQESKNYIALVGPGFAAFTLFNALCIISNGGNFDLVQAIVLNCGVVHARTTSGTSTVTQTIGLSFSPQTRATVSGAVMTRSTGMTAVNCAPTFSTVTGSTVNQGIVRGLLCAAPGVALFQPATGTENLTAYYGIDFLNITNVTSGDKVVVRSAMTAAADRYFLQNNGGAQSDFGGGTLIDCRQITQPYDLVGRTIGASADWQDGWAAGNFYFWQFNALADQLRFSNPAADRFLFDTNGGNTVAEFNFNCHKFSLGAQTGAVGNQVGVFAAPTRTTSVNGGWSDFLLTQAGNLTIDDTMTSVAAWTINPVSLTSGTGSITGYIACLEVGSMTTSGVGSNETMALRSTGRFQQRGTVQYEPIAPAELSGTITAWNGLITATQSNAGRYWARITVAAGATLEGIDSTTAQDGDTYEITNVDASDALTISNEAGGAAAADRIILGDFGGELEPDETITIRYDITTTRWRVISSTGFALSAAYTPTNVTTDRTYDANSTTLDEVADVLGTLIADLQTRGILA